MGILVLRCLEGFMLYPDRYFFAIISPNKLLFNFLTSRGGDANNPNISIRHLYTM